MAEQKAAVRILLCGPAGQLALKTYEPAALKPRNVIEKRAADKNRIAALPVNHWQHYFLSWTSL